MVAMMTPISAINKMRPIDERSVLTNEPMAAITANVPAVMRKTLVMLSAV